ncbi:MAG: hypothetical protein JXN64_00990 [Spirochaetes bacterium]|nr:hypothetical protein [Spirochaetota bacterium]
MKNTTLKNSIGIFIIILILCIVIYPKTAMSIPMNKLFDETVLITDNTLKFVTPPPDFRAYFMLQSIDDTTVILISNFTNPEKVITLIIDEGSDNTVDSVVEYFPERKRFKRMKKIESKSIKSDIAELKKDIIEGVIFEKNYSYQMKSLNALKKKINEGSDRYFTDAGTRIVIYDSEKTSSPTSEFFFKVKEDRYDLIFRTIYYRLYHTIIQPPISFSVYCRNSKDPVVSKYAKELLDMIPR